MAELNNTTDKIQRKSVVRREKQRREREENDLRVVLSSPEGRRFLWRLIGECGVFASVCRDGFGDFVVFRSGQQDVGHKLQAWILEANEGAYLTMQREAWTFAKKDKAELQAEVEALTKENENATGEDS